VFVFLLEDEAMSTFAKVSLQDQLLASTAADAGNPTELLRQGVFAVCRRWNQVL
jgi:hypothetical protein